MSFEGLWYSMYSEDGVPPKCKRLSRMPMQMQIEAAPDLALAFALGEAGYRQATISSTGEQYWYWPHPESQTGWWLLPQRIVKRAVIIVQDATMQACRENHGCAFSDQIADVIRRWKRTGAWRKRVGKVVSRRELIDPVVPRWRPRPKGRLPKPPESAICECGRRWQDARALGACPKMLAHRVVMCNRAAEAEDGY